MTDHLKGPQQSVDSNPPRVNKTSVEARRSALKSQAGTRLMGLTGGLRKPREDKDDTIEEESEMNDIIQSYRIEEEIQPRMRMKWKSGHEPADRY